MALLTRVSFGARFSLQGEREEEAMRKGRRERRGKEGKKKKDTHTTLRDAERLRDRDRVACIGLTLSSVNAKNN